MPTPARFVYVHRSREAWRRAAGPRPLKPEDVEWLARLLTAAATSGGLTSWELEFIGDLDSRLSRWGAKLYLSDRQRAVLEEIAAKLGLAS